MIRYILLIVFVVFLSGSAQAAQTTLATNMTSTFASGQDHDDATTWIDTELAKQNAMNTDLYGFYSDTEIDALFTAGTSNWYTTGTISGNSRVTEATSERVLTAQESASGIIRVTFAGEVRIPDVCDTATGAAVMIVQGDPSEVVEVAVTDTSDHLWLDGVDLGANYEVDSPGAAKEDDYIVFICSEANNWHSKGRAGTWVTGGAAD